MPAKLTVYFDGSFYIGIFEKSENGVVHIYKHVFGSEPSDAEVLQFTRENFHKLPFQATPEQAPEKESHTLRKLKKLAEKAMAQAGPGTRSMRAVKAAMEGMKKEKKAQTRQEKLLQEQELYKKKVEKRKKKKQGH
jgi:hypothetical protein